MFWEVLVPLGRSRSGSDPLLLLEDRVPGRSDPVLLIPKVPSLGPEPIGSGSIQSGICKHDSVPEPGAWTGRVSEEWDRF